MSDKMSRENLMRLEKREAIDIQMSTIFLLEETVKRQAVEIARLNTLLNEYGSLKPGLKKNRKPNNPLVTYAALGALCLAGILIGFFYMYGTQAVRAARVADAQAAFDDIVGGVTDSNAELETELPNTASYEMTDNTDNYEEIPEPAPIIREPRQEFIHLQEAFENEDIIGHLSIAGTSIYSIVVQADDNEFYLDHDVWRNPSIAGWIFADYMVDIASEDHNIVIYGHNMSADLMFHSLRHFQDFEFLRAHSRILFSTIYDDYEWEIFSFYIAHISFPYTNINFHNDPASQDYWGNWIRIFAEMSMHHTGIEVSSEDRILTLSTCINGQRNTDYRFVLHARLIN